MTDGSQTRRIALDDGRFTHVEEWGRGPILLCVHGITSSRKSWRRTAEHFAPTYRVVAYDQRGHGDSSAVDGPMTLERSVADLEAVRATLDGDVEALIGHSWGGAVAILGGRRIDCRRVIAIDPMIHQAAGMWDADFVDDVREVLAIAPAERVTAIRTMFAGLPEVEVEAKVHAMQAMRIESIQALGAANAADTGGWDLRPALRDYPKPLFLALADPSDSVIAPADLVAVRRDGGAQVTIEVFSGEGHTLQRTAFDRFVAASERFLNA